MTHSPHQPLLVGALLVGGSLLTGNATIITVAGGVGINLTSEGIASLWGTPRTPLVAAGTRAMRATVRELEKEFKQTRPLPTPSPFQLLRDSVNDLAQADLSQPYANANAVQQALAQHLDQLLYGHDEHAVALSLPNPRVLRLYKQANHERHAGTRRGQVLGDQGAQAAMGSGRKR